MIGNATNIEEFKKFLVQVARAFRNPYAQVKPRLIMDNHPAHRSRNCRELLNQYYRPAFQPAYNKSIITLTDDISVIGSPFNVVETCWA